MPNLPLAAAIEARLRLVAVVTEFAQYGDTGADHIAQDALHKTATLTTRLPPGSDLAYSAHRHHMTYLLATHRSTQAIPMIRSAWHASISLGRIAWAFVFATTHLAASSTPLDTWRAEIVPFCQTHLAAHPILVMHLTMHVAHQVLARSDSGARDFTALKEYFDAVEAAARAAANGGTVVPRRMRAQWHVLEILASLKADRVAHASTKLAALQQLLEQPSEGVGEIGFATAQDGGVDVLVANISHPLVLAAAPIQPVRLETWTESEVVVVTYLVSALVNRLDVQSDRARLFLEHGVATLQRHAPGVRFDGLLAAFYSTLFDVALSQGQFKAAAETFDLLASLATPPPTHVLHLHLAHLHQAANDWLLAFAHFDAVVSDRDAPASLRDVARLGLAQGLVYAADSTTGDDHLSTARALLAACDPETHASIAPAVAMVRVMTLTEVNKQKKALIDALKAAKDNLHVKTAAMAVSGAVLASLATYHARASLQTAVTMAAKAGMVNVAAACADAVAELHAVVGQDAPSAVIDDRNRLAGKAAKAAGDARDAGGEGRGEWTPGWGLEQGVVQ
ncbi:hypothetical protein AMAG_15948 [Allomyces macrogynus ATCC 38327]|uniref:Uncharacterized protein n=1 Tax=Allomyces macrogynus (strain ATCC 38327) TaxID=578462 RepID=A0A0L0TB85_ALLM3|nr:hypothetical protein AMAG_15948 [Allomyces macrogynus ATCC 38327]|eukprot:KNE72007.1 hypothetical protein AMAG_15948 [Allomyces macrogynus ATCC 38327]